MNVGVAQIRGALLYFLRERMPFYIFARHCFQFFNPFVLIAPLLYPLKTSENLPVF